MKHKNSVSVRIIVLFSFLSVTLFISYFCIENTMHPSEFCPACHLQDSILATDLVTGFNLSQLTLLEILKTFEFSHHSQTKLSIPLSRPPPFS
jgi:hypothetical protein